MSHDLFYIIVNMYMYMYTLGSVLYFYWTNTNQKSKKTVLLLSSSMSLLLLPLSPPLPFSKTLSTVSISSVIPLNPTKRYFICTCTCILLLLWLKIFANFVNFEKVQKISPYFVLVCKKVHSKIKNRKSHSYK